MRTQVWIRAAACERVPRACVCIPSACCCLVSAVALEAAVRRGFESAAASRQARGSDQRSSTGPGITVRGYRHVYRDIVNSPCHVLLAIAHSHDVGSRAAEPQVGIRVYELASLIDDHENARGVDPLTRAITGDARYCLGFHPAYPA